MKLKAEVVDSNFSVTKFREGVDKATAKMKMPEGITIENEKTNHFNAEWIIPENQFAKSRFLHFTGNRSEVSCGVL